MDHPWALLKSFVWRHKWSYLVSTLSIIISEFITVQFPNLLGQFTDALKAGSLTPSVILHYSLLLLAVGLGYGVFFGVGQFRNGQLGRLFEYELRDRLFAHWLTLSTAYFRKRSIGDLLNHALNDVQSVRELVSMSLNQITNAIFLLVATLWMTLRTIDARLTLVSIVPILCLPLLVILVGPRIRLASRKVQESLSDMADLTEESLSAIRLTKATANETVEVNRFAERVSTIVDRQMSMVQISSAFQAVFPLVESLSFAIALLYGGTLTLHGQLRLGSFVAFTFYLAMFVNPLQQIGNVVNTFQRTSASLARLSVLFTERSDIQDPTIPDAVAVLTGEVAVRLPEYRYPDGHVPALKDISFTVREGQTLGIVGRTASGKTTLVNLLPRIFDPPSGTVFVGGHDVRKLRLDTLRHAIAYVPQDGFLFSTTIRANIGFGKESATPSEITRAAEAAVVLDDILRFKDQFDTIIGERGVTLSGGQKQRTAMARAFLRDAAILILDDSLSAVDMNTEKQIIEHLRQVREGRTTIIVANRLSAVRHADWILVMDNGSITEQGTHESLLADGGIYADLHLLQQMTEPSTLTSAPTQPMATSGRGKPE